MRYIFGNFKANKTKQEMEEWLDTFTQNYTPHDSVSVGIFPQFPHIVLAQQKLAGLKNVFVGSQTLSSYDEGSHTGEVTAAALKGLVSYTIVGHSERRKEFLESDEVLVQKVIRAKQNAIEPVYCIRNESDPIPSGVLFVAYEPVAAIGTGKNEPPEQTVIAKKKIKLPEKSVFIYGGSVNATNSVEYLKTNEIDGFLIGKITLDPHQFLAVIAAAHI